MLQFIQDKNIENSRFEAFQTLPTGRIRIAWVRTSQTLKYSLGSFPFRCILHFLFRLWAGRKCWENSAIYGHEYKSLQKLRWVRLFGRWSLKWSLFSKTFENFLNITAWNPPSITKCLSCLSVLYQFIFVVYFSSIVFCLYVILCFFPCIRSVLIAFVPAAATRLFAFLWLCC